jgi:hypothetical protein
MHASKERRQNVDVARRLLQSAALAFCNLRRCVMATVVPAVGCSDPAKNVDIKKYTIGFHLAKRTKKQTHK